MPDIEQGPQAGRRWRPESKTYTDPTTGAEVTRLTSSLAHDHHCYFTRSGWDDDVDRVIFASDRTGSPNLFAYNGDRGFSTELTDLPPLEDTRGLRGYRFPFQFTSCNEIRGEAYFWYGDTLQVLDLESLSLRTLYEKPPNYLANMTHYTADGETICTIVFEDVRSELPEGIGWTPM